MSALTSSRIYSIGHDLGTPWPEYEWAWECPCGDEDRQYGSATAAQESLDQHVAFCVEA